MFCTDVNLPHHTTPASRPSSVGMVEVEHAHSLTQSRREVLWALPQPGDCGKSARAPGPSLSDAPVSGLLGQVCFPHGTASLCPGFS